MRKFSTKKFLADPNNYAYLMVRTPVILKNGQTISIQQSPHHYCNSNTCEVYYPDGEQPEGYQTYEEIDTYVNSIGLQGEQK